MPGYHVEWVRGQNEPSVPHASPDDLAQLEWAMAGSLPNELPPAELNTSLYGKLYPVQVRKAQPIPPKLINMPTPAVALADPTPWAEAYKEQKLFGNITLATIILLVLLAAIGAPFPLIAVLEAVGLVAFVLNRRKRREVLDIKELSGYDVTEEREQFRKTNRLIGGTVIASMVLQAVLAILLILSFTAFIESLFSW